MIDRHLIRYFLAVIDTGTFSGAATLCRVSQPTVSSGIARLEDYLGQLVFNRSNRRVELTAAGARLVPHARRIETEFVEAQRAIADIQPRALIRIGIASTIQNGLVEGIVSACVRAADITLEVVERRPSEMMALLDRGRVDLILAPVEPGSRRPAIELFADPYLLVMAESHVLAGEDMISSDQLTRETMLVRRQCEALPLVSQFFTARGIRPFMAARSVSEHRVAGYVRGGLGVTVMPRSLVEHGIAARPLAGLDISRTVGLVLDPEAKSRLSRSGVIELIGALASQPSS